MSSGHIWWTIRGERNSPVVVYSKQSLTNHMRWFCGACIDMGACIKARIVRPVNNTCVKAGLYRPDSTAIPCTIYIADGTIQTGTSASWLREIMHTPSKPETSINAAEVRSIRCFWTHTERDWMYVVLISCDQNLDATSKLKIFKLCKTAKTKKWQPLLWCKAVTDWLQQI